MLADRQPWRFIFLQVDRMGSNARPGVELDGTISVVSLSAQVCGVSLPISDMHIHDCIVAG